MRKKRIKKRTRLIALLSALATLAVGGIGTGLAFSAMAATSGQSSAASARTLSKPKGSRSEEASQASKGAVLADTNPLAFCQGGNSSKYSYCQGYNTDAFNSSAQVNYLAYAPSQGQYTGWAGQQITASVTLDGGTQMPIAMPIGLWNGSSFVNPNTLTPGELEETMLNGDYMGNIGVISQSAGNKWYSFLGGVNYDGTLDAPMTKFVSSNSYTISHNMLNDSINGKLITLQPESLQYQFQGLCNESELLSNPYFASMTSNSVSYLQGALQEIFFGTGTNGEPLGLYNSDEAFYGTFPDKGVSSDLANLKSQADDLISNIGDYKMAVAAYSAAIKAGKSAADARSAYLNSLKGTVGLDSDGGGGKYQPLLCLAVWDQNVGYNSLPQKELLYTQGSDVKGDTSNAFDGTDSGNNTYSYAYWGAGPSYVGTGTASDSTLSLTLTPTATDFVEELMGSSANSGGIQLTAIYYPGQASTFYSAKGGGVSVDIQPVLNSKGGVVLKGMGQYVSFRSLGLTPNDVNPTSLPSGVTLSTSSPASDGLYFKAVSQSGEPLKSVEMQLWPDQNASSVQNWHWEGWIYTPISIATNSAPKGVTSADWPYLGSTYWAGYYHNVTFTASSLSSQEGWFDFSGVAPGAYEVKILSGTTESGKTVSYGSYYTEPTFEIDASSYSSPETVSAVSDPCGFVDPAEDEVVVGASNPSSSITQGAAAPKSGTNDPYTATVGSKNPFTYQAEAYMPFDLSGQGGASSAPLTFSLSSLPKGETLNQGSVEVNGKSLKSLGITPTSSSSSGVSFALSPKDIASIGSQGGTIDVTFTAYLDPSFTSPGTPKYEFAYKAYGAANSGNSEEDLSAVSTNGPAGQDYSKVSLDPASSPSSETGLWFKDLQADGAESTGAKFEVQNSSGQYLNGDPSNFSGWTWSSTPQQFSASSLGTGTFAFGGLADGTYFVTLTQWPEEMMKGTEGNGENTGKDNWASAPYPMGVATGSAATDSFQVVLSYSSPEDTTSINDPAGLVDHSSDSMYSLAPVKMAPVNGSSLSSQAYQTETVGVPFTEGWEGYLPFDSVNPYSSTLSSGIQVAFPEGDGGLNNGGNSSGLQMDSPATSNVEVAGIPLSQLISKGGLPSSDVTSSGGIYTIEIPGSVLSYIENNGKNEAGEPLSSSSNRLVIISFPALMTTSFKEGGQFQQWMALGADDGWWIQKPGGAWGVYSSPLYTNGPADNSVPSSLSPSENSSKTGIWFKSLWYGTSTPATGSKYTVQNSSGKYLTPVESDGTFEGWSWSTSPYDFSEQNSSAVFSFGGLSDGAYTLTQVDPAKGATPSSLTFTSTLSYPSPQSLKAVKDSLNLLDSSKDTVWAMVVPSSLPFTGGKMILLVSLSAVVLFGAGAIFFILRKRRRA